MAIINKDGMYSRYVESGQSIYDLSIQEYGSIEHVFTLLLDNPTKINWNDVIVATTGLQCRRLNETAMISSEQSVLNHFRKQQEYINTHNYTQPTNFLLQENLDKILQENNFGILIN